MSEALTLQDLVSHVMDAADMDSRDIDYRRAMRSARWGYEQATTRHQWMNFDTQFTVLLNGQFRTTDTIAIDSTGQVQLLPSGGEVWPDWSDLGLLFLDEDRAYRVIKRIDDNNIVIDNWTGETEGALGNWTLRQDRAMIPDQVREVYNVWHQVKQWEIKLVDPKTFREYDRPRIYNGSDPVVATFRGVQRDGIYQTEIRVSPATTERVELDCAYTRRPRYAGILMHHSGVATGSDTLTLRRPIPTGVNVVNSLVRLSGNEAYATADEAFGIRNTNASIFEGLITHQVSNTVFTCPGVPTLTDAQVVITSMLDIPYYLLNPCKLYAEAQMKRIGSDDLRSYSILMNEANEELRFAMEQDAPFDRRYGRPMLRIDALFPVQDIYINQVSGN